MKAEGVKFKVSVKKVIKIKEGSMKQKSDGEKLAKTKSGK